MNKYDYLIAVFTQDETGKGHTAKFVTSTEGSTARWDAGKPAKRFSERTAKDIVYGLALNGYKAGMVTVLAGVTVFANPA